MDTDGLVKLDNPELQKEYGYSVKDILLDETYPLYIWADVHWTEAGEPVRGPQPLAMYQRQDLYYSGSLIINGHVNVYENDAGELATMRVSPGFTRECVFR